MSVSQSSVAPLLSGAGRILEMEIRMNTSHDSSNNAIPGSKNQPAKDWSMLGLRAGFIALGFAALGLLALILTGGFAIFLGVFLIIPMIILPFILSLAGLVMSIIGAKTGPSSKNTATRGIILNSVLLLSVVIFGQPFLGGGLKNDYLRSMSFSPDGKHLATGWGKEIHVLDAETGKRIHELRGHKDAVTFLDYSPDSKILASASYDGTVRLWDVAANQELYSFTMDGVLFEALSFSPDGKMVMAAIQEKGITLLDVATYTKIKTIPQMGDQVVIFSTDGAFVGFNGYSGLYFVNTDDFDKPVILPNAFGDRNVISPNNEIVAVSNRDLTREMPGELQVWNLSNQKMILTKPLDYRLSEVTSTYSVSLAISPDNKKLAYTTGGYNEGSYFDILDINTQQVISFEKTDHVSIFPSNIMFSPDGDRIALDITDNVMMWDVKSRKLLWQYP